MRRTKKLMPLAVGLIATLLLAGCQNGDDAESLNPASDGQKSEAEQDGYGDGSNKKSDLASPTKLKVKDDAELGQVVVDAKGFTLYRFDKDTADPPTSNCDAECEQKWPPVWASDEITIEGGDNSKTGTVEWENGQKQVTLGGWPLYYYAGDTAPEQTNGEAMGDVWWAVSPSGKKAKDDNGAGDDGGNAGAEEQNSAADGDNGGGGERQWTPGTTVLKTKKNDKLGEIIVDGEGRTLYRFDKDTADPPATNCDAACEEKWPRLMAGKDVLLDGQKVKWDGSDSEIGLLEFPDGSCQVTLGGWPLYYYAEDEKAGDVEGEGVGDVWWTVSPSGKRAKDDDGSGADVSAGKGEGGGDASSYGGGGGY
ncbi:SCO0930 family lipoprotein [Nocardiopsis rhodophaea]|uniref:SCO0930 family lipoprotein n=1 Tax=Nocardiopsis rhodophaea TaxID=280238 RepID=A0ABN2T1D5_9ACTN